jgi:hypothetical protein
MPLVKPSEASESFPRTFIKCNSMDDRMFSSYLRSLSRADRLSCALSGRENALGVDCASITVHTSIPFGPDAKKFKLDNDTISELHTIYDECNSRHRVYSDRFYENQKTFFEIFQDIFFDAAYKLSGVRLDLEGYIIYFMYALCILTVLGRLTQFIIETAILEWEFFFDLLKTIVLYSCWLAYFLLFLALVTGTPIRIQVVYYGILSIILLILDGQNFIVAIGPITGAVLYHYLRIFGVMSHPGRNDMIYDDIIAPLLISTCCCLIKIKRVVTELFYVDKKTFGKPIVFKDTKSPFVVPNTRHSESVDNLFMDEHHHKCKLCSVVYSHKHRFRGDHDQFVDQCPNVSCPCYHKGNNNTLAVVIDVESAPFLIVEEEDGTIRQLPSVGTTKASKPVPHDCIDAKHKTGLTQIAPVFLGKENKNFAPKQLHSCYFSNTSAALRNLIKRADYEPAVMDDFLTWWNTHRLPVYEQYYIDHFSSGRVPSVQEWINTKTGAKKDEYQEAYDELMSGKTLSNKQLLGCKAHIKVDEKCVDCTKTRNITAQNSFAKVLMGPLVDFVAKAHKKYDSSYGSGLNWSERQGKYNKAIKQFLDPVSLDIDGSGFDGTQWSIIKSNLDTKRYQYAHKLVSPYYETSRHYTNVIITSQMQYVRNKRIDFSYQVDGTVGSGFMSTSDGNGVRAADYVRFGLYGSPYIEGIHYFLETCGDDTKIICERENAEQIRLLLLSRVYTKDGTRGNLGQIAKYIQISELHAGNYLSSVWFKKDNGDYRIVRQVDRVLLFTPWSINNPKQNMKKEGRYSAELSLANAGSILSWGRGIRFFEAYASMLIRTANMQGVYNTAISVDNIHNDRTNDDNDDDSVAYEKWLKNSYGITQYDLDDYYNHCSQVKPYEVRNLSLIDKISEIDILPDYSINVRFMNEKGAVSSYYKREHNISLENLFGSNPFSG